MVQYTELLLEMWAKRRGEAVRWRVVVIIEAAKAFCRLLLLRITRSRPLVTPVLPEREKVPEPGEEEEEADDGKALAELMGEGEGSEHTGENGHANGSAAGDDGALVKNDGTNGNGNGHMNGNGTLHKLNGHHAPSTPPTPANPQKEWSMPRTGLTLPSLPAKGDISTYLLSSVLTADDIKPATKLLHSLAGSAHTAEVLHILAPLIYALALARTDPARRRTSWAPWLVGLSVQVAARQLAARAREGGGNGMRGSAAAAGGTALEREEWTRRGRAMWWWLMRGAAYENVVKGVVGGVRRRVPGFVGTILEDYEYLWENYYFSTSDS
jgi:peroxin-16